MQTVFGNNNNKVGLWVNIFPIFTLF